MTGVPTDLLDVLVCPETRQTLESASAALLESLNGAIHRGEIHNRRGDLLSEPIDAALISSDGKHIYPIQRGVADLIFEESIERSP